MSRSETYHCDGCEKVIDEAAGGLMYHVDRRDDFGDLGFFDACSPECLAVLAVADAHERGAAEEARAVRSKLAAAPKKTRKWWNR